MCESDTLLCDNSDNLLDDNQYYACFVANDHRELQLSRINCKIESKINASWIQRKCKVSKHWEIQEFIRSYE